jgi:hypothetical protein
MEMTLYDLLDAYEFEDIEDTFVILYGNKYVRNAVGYEEVFETLKEIEDVGLSDYKIVITFVDDSEELEDRYHHVNGKCDSEEHSVSLSLSPWKEWLGMKIDEYTFSRYSGREILCHCLWEMTYYGYNENAIRKFIEELDTQEYQEYQNINELFEELEEMEEEEESRKILETILRDEIRSSSSSSDH